MSFCLRPGSLGGCGLPSHPAYTQALCDRLGRGFHREATTLRDLQASENVSQEHESHLCEATAQNRGSVVCQALPIPLCCAKDCLRSRMPGGAISTQVSAGAEGKVLCCDRADPVSLPLPASSCPPLCLGQFPLWQPRLSSTATSSKKPRLILLVESSFAHSCFSIALGGFRHLRLAMLFKPA